MTGYVIMNVDMAETKYLLSQIFTIDYLLMVLPIWFVYHVCDHEIHPYSPSNTQQVCCCYCMGVSHGHNHFISS
jgi:fumarate reductase subunit D